MSAPSLLSPTLRRSELELKSDIIAQLVFHKQVLPPDVLIRARIGKYVARMVHNSNCTNIAENLLNRLWEDLTTLLYFAF